MTREIVSRLSMQSSAKHVRMILEGESVTYTGIRQILDEMIYNICENAIKYNHPGGSVSSWVGNTLEGPKVSVQGSEYQRNIWREFSKDSTGLTKAIPKKSEEQDWGFLL